MPRGSSGINICMLIWGPHVVERTVFDAVHSQGKKTLWQGICTGRFRLLPKLWPRITCHSCLCINQCISLDCAYTYMCWLRWSRCANSSVAYLLAEQNTYCTSWNISPGHTHQFHYHSGSVARLQLIHGRLTICWYICRLNALQIAEQSLLCSSLWWYVIYRGHDLAFGIDRRNNWNTTGDRSTTVHPILA